MSTPATPPPDEPIQAVIARLLAPVTGGWRDSTLLYVHFKHGGDLLRLLDRHRITSTGLLFEDVDGYGDSVRVRVDGRWWTLADPPREVIRAD